MLAAQSFYATRQPVQTASIQTLLNDMTIAANRNRTLYTQGLKTSRYHFHVVNSRNYAVTVIMTRYNTIKVRGKICWNEKQLLKAIENIKD